jgi:hypothetical protein
MDDTNMTTTDVEVRIAELGKDFVKAVAAQVDKAIRELNQEMQQNDLRLLVGEDTAIRMLVEEIIENVENRLWEYKPVFGGEHWRSPADDALESLRDTIIGVVDEEDERPPRIPDDPDPRTSLLRHVLPQGELDEVIAQTTAELTRQMSAMVVTCLEAWEG